MSTHSVVNEGPLVSVITPLFNESRHIRAALESLLNQSYRSIEVLVSDNCSTDGTWEIVQEYAKCDPRMQTHRQPCNVGQMKNGVKTLQMASGGFIMIGSGNDYWAPTFVSACMAELVKNDSTVLAYPQSCWMDMAGSVRGVVPQSVDTRGMDAVSRANVVLWGPDCYQIHGVFRRTAFENDLISRSLLYHEGVFLMNAALLGGFAQIPETLMHIQRSESMSGKQFMQKLSGDGRVGSASKADDLYYEMMRQYVAVVKERLKPGLDRNAIIVSVMLAMATKYRGFLQGASREAAGASAGPVRTDTESLIERVANEFDGALFGAEGTESLLRRTAVHDVLRQFTTDELVSMMTCSELATGVARRIKRAVSRRVSPGMQ